ncbi:MAG: histidine phosphatase family protein [Candidatus Omnitrophica bacterium]|nr:histidine phosphatase family protein [Candidatus Omnitrophota bacterium]MBU4488382.1 histidine phosphatase family protein [Candidatus Omnitrophota bacterium]MCG2705017.1 histidine phosphatase family protein [Candidatus Omnitrophota bacterium]
MQTKLIIIRHGITDWSLAKKYCGHTDMELNDIGRRQAAELCEALKNEKINAVYSSGAKRALQFARIAFGEFPVTVMTGLNEMDFGVFEGLTYEEIMREYPEIYSKWIDNPHNVNIPEGENMKDFIKRIETPLNEIIRQNANKTIALITHAGTIKAIISDILEIEDMWKTRLEWGSVCAVVSNEEKGNRWVRLPLF